MAEFKKHTAFVPVRTVTATTSKRTEGGRVMALEWYEWECPHCRRYGQVNPREEYEDGEHWAQRCPVCGAEIVVLCSYEPVFYAYRKESWKEGGDD